MLGVRCTPSLLDMILHSGARVNDPRRTATEKPPTCIERSVPHSKLADPVSETSAKAPRSAQAALATGARWKWAAVKPEKLSRVADMRPTHSRKPCASNTLSGDHGFTTLKRNLHQVWRAP